MIFGGWIGFGIGAVYGLVTGIWQEFGIDCLGLFFTGLELGICGEIFCGIWE